jgi:hypothetical protein
MSVWGNLLLPVLFGMSLIILFGLLWVFMVLMLTMIEGCYGMNKQDCLIGGIYCDVLGLISISFAFRARDRVIPDLP